MNQLVFILGAAVPTAWLLWRRGWIDKKRRYGVVLAIVSVCYFVIMRSLPERSHPQASVDTSIPTQAEIDQMGKQAAQHANPPPVHPEAFPSSDTFSLSARPATQRSR